MEILDIFATLRRRRCYFSALAVIFGGLSALHAQTAGVFKDIHDFGPPKTSNLTTWYLPAETPITLDSAGNRYGANDFGGVNGNGMIWELKADGSFVDLYDLPTYNDSDASPIGSIAIDSKGNLYGTFYMGGPNHPWNPGDQGGGSVWKLTPTGLFTHLHYFGATITTSTGKLGVDGVSPESGVTLDSQGNLYGTAFDGGYYSNLAYAGNPQGGMVWEITSAGVYKDLHDFGQTGTTSGGQPMADGSHPVCAVTVDPQGDLIGTTLAGGLRPGTNVIGYGTIWEFTSSGNYEILHNFGGRILNADGKIGFDGFCPYAGVTLDSGGNLYGTTYYGGGATPDPNQIPDAGMVWELTSGGTYKDLHDFGETIVVNGQSIQDAQCPAAGVSIDADGNLIGSAIEDGLYNVGDLFKLTTSGVYTVLHWFGGPVTLANGSQGMDGTGPYFTPAVDAYGRIFAFDPTLPDTNSDFLWEYDISNSIDDFSASVTDPIGGTTVTGQVTLDYAAPAGGTVVSFSSGSSTLKVPSSVTIPAGSNTASFNITSTPVASQTTVTVSAKCGSSSRDKSFIVRAAAVSKLAFSPNTLVGGLSTGGTVTLIGPAPTGGLVVDLTSNSSSVKVPSSVTIPAGSSTGTFTVNTSAVAANTTVTIGATGGGGSTSYNILLETPSLVAFGLSSTSVVGGQNSIGTVTLADPAPVGGAVVSLSATAGASVPASVTVPANSTSATFTVKTSTVASASSATITATRGSVAKSVKLTLNPTALASLTLTASSVAGSSTTVVMGTVTFNAPVTSNLTVTLKSSNPSAASVPATVSVAAGSSSATFTVSHYSVTTTQSVVISATYGSITKTITLQVTPFTRR